jgi:heterodisulfide reductase subunit A-like polyferredoxin
MPPSRKVRRQGAVQAIGERLDLLSRRIGAIQHKPKTSRHVAVIDRERCLGCGVCETFCPVGAITVRNSALVNPFRCTGCGRCAEECPQGAIVLRPYQTAGTLVSLAGMSLQPEMKVL